MSGRLGLSSPWARELFPAAVRQEIEATIPEGWAVGVKVSPDKGYVTVWPLHDGEMADYISTSRVSAARRAVDECVAWIGRQG